MKLATSTGDFVSYYDNEREKLEAVRRAGFDCVDLGMYRGAHPGNWLMADGWEANAKDLKNRAAELGMTLVQAHSPGGNLLSEDGFERLFEATARSIRVCGLLDIPVTVVHSGICGHVPFEEYCERNAAVYRKLLSYAEDCGVALLIENTGTWVGENTYFFTGAEMKRFLDFMASPFMGACWDTGHANVMNLVQSEELATLGTWLRAVHIQDNFGETDNHTAPFFGTLDIDDVMKGLLDAHFTGAFTFEADQFPLYGQSWPNSRKRKVDADRLYHPDILIKDEAERLLHTIGVRILSEYGLAE